MQSLQFLRNRMLFTVAIVGLSCAAHAADPGILIVKVDQPGAKISPMFYGMMTEEINYSHDGGLYAELLRNRIFKEGAIGGGRGEGLDRGAVPDPNVPPLPGLPAPGGMQWPTDLIGYDGPTSFGSAGYYVEKMFYNNRGDVVLPVSLANIAQGTIFSSSSRDEATGDIILTVVNTDTVAQSVELTFQGAATIGKIAEGELLTAGLTDMNSVAGPRKVVPRKITVREAALKFVHEFPASSVTVLRFKTK